MDRIHSDLNSILARPLKWDRNGNINVFLFSLLSARQNAFYWVFMSEWFSTFVESNFLKLLKVKIIQIYIIQSMQ